MLQEIHKLALRRAAEIMGGNEELMRHLGATEEQFSTWKAQRDLPRDVFLRLVDIITEETVRGVRLKRCG